MRHTHRSGVRLAPLLLALLVCASARPAGAIGGAGLQGMAQLIQDLDGSNPVIANTFTADAGGVYNFARTFDTGNANGNLTVVGNADPGIGYALTLQNTRGTDSIFDFGVAIEMVPFAAGVPLFGNMSITLFDTGGDPGATLTALFLSCADFSDPTSCKPDPIVQFFSLSEGNIETNFTTIQDMDLGLTVDVTGVTQNFGANAVSPAPDLSLGPGWSEMGMSARFQLSPGDTVIIGSTAVVVPEPRIALLLGLGLLALIRH